MTNHSPERDRIEQAYRAGVILQTQDIERAILDGIQIPESVWQDVNLRRSNMNEAGLQKAVWQDIEVANTGLRAANFSGGWLDAVRFTLCDLAQIDLSGASLRDVTIEESPAPFAQFDGSLLSRVNMRVVDLQSASMRQAALLHSAFKDERLGGANLMNVDLSGAILLDCNLAQANLQGANLTGAILLGVDLRGANLEDADLTDAVGYDVHGAPRLQQVDDPRAAHFLLHQRASQYGAMGRLALELAWASLIDGTQTIQGNRDVAANLLRQRNLSFSDLMRFIKERFPHRELDKFVIDGDQVGVRADTGTVPITDYGGSSRMGQGTAPRSNAPPNPGATGIDAFRRSGGAGSRPAEAEPAAASSRGADAPSPARAPAGGERRPERPGRPAPPNPEETDVFADSRFGLIDLDEDDAI